VAEPSGIAERDLNQSLAECKSCRIIDAFGLDRGLLDSGWMRAVIRYLGLMVKSKAFLKKEARWIVPAGFLIRRQLID
jgi:hypothetical protein